MSDAPTGEPLATAPTQRLGRGAAAALKSHDSATTEFPKGIRAKTWAKATRLANYLTPPILIEAASRLRRTIRYAITREKEMIEWEYIPEGWRAEQSDPHIKGWNVNSVLEAYKKKWPDFVRSVQSTAPFGVAPEDAPTPANVIFHNIMMSYAYALALSSRHKSALSMLDWGGGIGHYYIISQAVLPDVEIDYHCKDVPVLAEHGQQLFPQAHFHTDDACLTRRYDFVLASTSLHYSQDWAATLQGLARATAGYVFITQLPVAQRAPSYVFVQRPYQYGYDTEYLGWCLNRGQFLECAGAAGLELVREFMIGHRPPIHRAPEQCEYRGFLFRSR